MNIGIVICSRQESERIPDKPFKQINGKPLIQHLVKQLQKTNLPIFVTVPQKQKVRYMREVQDNAFVVGSEYEHDPLARTYETAVKARLDVIVRVTHDKIFVDIPSLLKMLTHFIQHPCDYMYSSDLIPGTGFEIFSRDALAKACTKFKDVEFLSYALRLVSQSTVNVRLKTPEVPFHLLIDFPEDLKLHEVIISQLGVNSSLEHVINYLSKNPELHYINRPPLVTIYTCAYNAEKYLLEAMQSVVEQTAFKTSMEYLLIDDGSTDKTCEIMAKFALKNKSIMWFRNQKNVGLASSSNIAIKKARGRYIIRLDADDYFTDANAVINLVNHIRETRAEAVYPDNYFGNFNDIQSGNHSHHVGGALFDRKAINFIKFTEGLRGYEGLDLFERAKDKLVLNYYRKPVFFYRQHPESLTKNNLQEREKIKQAIYAKI